MARILDLTHPITADMPVYPGTTSPVIEVANTVAEHGFLEHRLTMVTHTGTHVDAPAHMLVGGRTLDTYPADTFVGPATVLDVSAVTGDIGRELLEPHRDVIARQAFLLLHTGWSARWGDESYFCDYPALSVEAAAWLGELGLRGIGLDAVSIDECLRIRHSWLGTPKRAIAPDNLLDVYHNDPLFGTEASRQIGYRDVDR